MSGKEIPLSKGLPLLGHLFDYKKDRLMMLRNAHKEYGGIFKLKVGPKTLVVFTQPEQIEHVLQKNMNIYIKKTNADQIFGKSIGTANGEEWKKQRALIQPLLNPRYFADIFDDVKTIAKKNSLHFVKKLNNGSDIRELFSKITYDIILKCMIGLDSYDKFHDIDNAIQEMTDFISNDKYSFIQLPEAFNKKKQAFNKSLKLLNDIIYEGIDSADLDNPRSLVSVLKKEIQANDDIKDKKAFIRDNIFTLLYAGYDTSALTLSWLSVEFAQNPEWVEKCFEEVKNLDFDNLSYSDIKDLPMTSACIFETMRLYPPGWAFTRFATQDDDLCGYKINEGDILLYSPYLTHRDATLWENPDSFNPERFVGVNPAQMARFKFIPFGAGPRTCTGMQFGMMEIKTILIFILQNYKFELVGDLPQMDARVTLFSTNNYQVKLKDR